MLACGIARRSQAGSKNYLSFRCWYVELLIRLHLTELELADGELQKHRLDELIPEITALGLEAYRLIHGIENDVRNFVALYLCQCQPRGASILHGRHKKYDRERARFEDAHERAKMWRDQSERDGLLTSVNPLIAYCSTRDLAGLITEIGAETQSAGWSEIAQSLLRLAEIRDAVMHNQLVDDRALQQLYALQADIYQALNASQQF